MTTKEDKEDDFTVFPLRLRNPKRIDQALRKLKKTKRPKTPIWR